jgi:alpha-glucuronidase
VKAGSEGRPGPHAYGRSHAEGANVLAEAVAPYGGVVAWRCFVYDSEQDWRDRAVDRAKAAFDEFTPLEGRFAANVVLQVKAGPMDFQVREPPAPLLGAMPGTSKLVEVQLAQEYTGQQVHACYLVPAWSDVLTFGTRGEGHGPRVSDLVLRGGAGDPALTGMAGVANVGDSPNWTGHLLAQANLYGFGRLAWSPEKAPASVAEEWSRQSFGWDEEVTSTVTGLLMASPGAYEAYTSPLGLGWLVTPGSHWGPSPDGYEYSRWGTYHRADRDGVGVDRTRATGTGFTAQYGEPWASVFDDPQRCPEELLLFFHHLAFSHRMASGRTLAQHIYDSHFRGVEQVGHFLERWRALSGRVDVVRHRPVEGLLAEQLESAREWRDVVNAYFHRKWGCPDLEGRPLY